MPDNDLFTYDASDITRPPASHGPADEAGPGGLEQVAIAAGVVLVLALLAIAPAVVVATWRALL